MSLNWCDICNDPCLMQGIGFKAQEENFRFLVAQALCNLSRALGDGQGLTPGYLLSLNTTNATVIKNAPGDLGFLTASNINAAPRYLKLYDQATVPNVGTDIPILDFLIPGNNAGTGTKIPIPTAEIDFVNGIAFALTTGAGVSDTGAVAAGEILVNYGYK